MSERFRLHTSVNNGRSVPVNILNQRVFTPTLVIYLFIYLCTCFVVLLYICGVWGGVVVVGGGIQYIIYLLGASLLDFVACE